MIPLVFPLSPPPAKALMGLVACLLLSAGCSRAEGEPSRLQTGSVPVRVRVDPTPIVLGAVRPGNRARAEFRVENPTADTLVLSRIETSCPCVSVEPASATIPARGRQVFIARFDPSGEPDFRGSLGVRVTGCDASGTEVLRTEVDVAVVEESLTPSAPFPGRKEGTP